MKKNYREISIYGKKEFYKLERFIEEICDFHNINNEYFGNILLASTEAANILISVSKQEAAKLIVSFEKTIKGFTFTLKFHEQDIPPEPEHYLEQEIRRHKLNKEIYIIKALADEVTISITGKSITLIFYVSSMNYEKSLIRINKLKEYWIKTASAVNKGNE